MSGPATATPGGRDAPRGPGVAGCGAVSGGGWQGSWGCRRRGELARSFEPHPNNAAKGVAYVYVPRSHTNHGDSPQVGISQARLV